MYAFFNILRLRIFKITNITSPDWDPSKWHKSVYYEMGKNVFMVNIGFRPNVVTRNFGRYKNHDYISIRQNCCHVSIPEGNTSSSATNPILSIIKLLQLTYPNIMISQPLEFTNKIFEIFEPSLRAELEANSMPMEVKSGDIILNIGQIIRTVPLLVSGTIRVSHSNEEGRELLLYYVKEGESCAMTFSCCMLAQTSVIKAVAEENAKILFVPVRLMDEWMQKYPSWKRYVMTSMLNRFKEIIRCMEEVTFKKLDERLVNYLKEKSKITGSSVLNLTHQKIGLELGTNRVVISRLLKKLEDEEKLLLYNKQIKLLNSL
jgi:CRP/FNR family transcriptional regulator